MTSAEFFDFIADYRALIRERIPGNYLNHEYDSRLYMLPVYRHLRRVLKGTPAGGRVLDLGCGRGHYAAYLSLQGLDAVGIEVREPKPDDDLLLKQDPESIKHYQAVWDEAQRRYGSRCSYFDGKDLDFPAGSFDAVLFYATYEHIPVEHIAAMTRAAFRVLKPGGRAFVFRCPSSLAWAEHTTRALGMGGHEKLYGKSEILGLLRGAGFEVESFGRSDLIPAHIHPVQGALNALAEPILALEWLLMLTPLRLIAHHYEIVARKPRGEAA